MVSHVIRQKLIVGIERAMPRAQSQKMGLLFLPEGEYHELGLLYVHYLLKQHGVGVLYLGADLPLSDLEHTCALKKPDFLYCHLTGITGSFKFDTFFSRITQRIGIPLVLSGALARAHVRKVPSTGVDLRQTLAEVQEFVNTL